MHNTVVEMCIPNPRRYTSSFAVYFPSCNQSSHVIDVTIHVMNRYSLALSRSRPTKVIHTAHKKIKRPFVPYSLQTSRCWHDEIQPVIYTQRPRDRHRQKMLFLFCNRHKHHQYPTFITPKTMTETWKFSTPQKQKTNKKWLKSPPKPTPVDEGFI